LRGPRYQFRRTEQLDLRALKTSAMAYSLPQRHEVIESNRMSDADHLAGHHASAKALVIIDMINVWNMPGGADIRRAARAMIPKLSRLIQSARRANVAVIYANDNFGRWRSDLSHLMEQSRQSHRDAAAIVDAIAPEAADYIVLKPEHSAFYASPLEPLLKALRARHLVLTGVSGDQCVLATAGDALLRDYEVSIPRDAIACASPARTRAVLRHFQQVMELRTPEARRIKWH
jgi:nicotinamidase-related amidase